MSRRLFWTILFGNILEYFDFALFAHLAIVISSDFFPSNEPIANALWSLCIFAVGFLMRPLGGWLFGHIGDEYGRRKTLIASIICMTIPTLGIALTPTFHQIGILAPVCLLFFRLMQGLSLGGEYTNSGILLMEFIPRKRRSFFSSIHTASGAFGNLLALFAAVLTMHANLPPWGWRIPFLMAAFLGIFNFILRKQLHESPVFKELIKTLPADALQFQKPIRFDRKNTLSLFILISVSGLCGCLVWTPVVFTPLYTTTVFHFDTLSSLLLASVSLLTYITLLPLFGNIADRVGLSKIMFTGAFITYICAYPLFYAASNGFIILFQICMGILAAIFNGSTHALCMKLFPAQTRCRLSSIGFSLGISLLGSSSPLISGWMVKNFSDHSLPAIYLMAVSFLATIAVITFMHFERRLNILSRTI